MVINASAWCFTDHRALYPSPSIPVQRLEAALSCWALDHAAATQHRLTQTRFDIRLYKMKQNKGIKRKNNTACSTLISVHYRHRHHKDALFMALKHSALAGNNPGCQISACERVSSSVASRFPGGRVLAWRGAPVCISEAGDHDIRPRLSACNRDVFESALLLPAGHIPRFSSTNSAPPRGSGS